jgi:hypothetical protein
MAISTSSADIKSVRVPTINGNREAFSKAYKFRSAIDDKKESDLPDKEEPQSGDTKEQEAARERKSTAVYYLTLAFESGESMKFICKDFTKDYPNGLAHLVIKALLKKFKPQDAISNLEFTQALMRIKMNRKDNPAVLFTQISTLQNSFGVYNTEEQPPRVDHLDVVGRLTPSMKWKPRIHNAPLTCEPGGSASNETCARCRCNLN